MASRNSAGSWTIGENKRGETANWLWKILRSLEFSSASRVEKDQGEERNADLAKFPSSIPPFSDERVSVRMSSELADVPPVNLSVEHPKNIYRIFVPTRVSSSIHPDIDIPILLRASALSPRVYQRITPSKFCLDYRDQLSPEVSLLSPIVPFCFLYFPTYRR